MRYRLGVSIALGLLSFLELYFPIHYWVQGYELNIIWHRLFSLILALAWGPQYAMVSLIAGLSWGVYLAHWIPAGWNAVVILAYYLLWLMIHGMCAVKRQTNFSLRYNLYFVQGLFSLLNTFLILVVYPWLSRYNPPPWLQLSDCFIPRSGTFAGMFVAKSLLSELVIVAVADVLLLLPIVRRGFHLPVKSEQRHNGKALALSVGYSALSTVIIYGLCELLTGQEITFAWLFQWPERFRIAMAFAVIFGCIFGSIGIRFLQHKLKTDDAFHHSEEKWRNLFENMHEIYMETTLDGLVTMISPSVQAVLGYAPQEILDKNSECIYADPEERLRLLTQYHKYGTMTNSEVELKDKSGNLHWVALNAVKQTKPDGSCKIISVARDITDLKMALDTIQKMNSRLEQRVEERTRELESFAYTVSHDLKSPLRAIEGYSQIIREDFGNWLEPELAIMVQKIQTISDDMICFIDKLLEYVTTTRMEITWENVGMPKLITTVFEELKLAYPQRPVMLEVDEGVPTQVYADRVLLKQILINLLSNAFKFTKDRAPARIKVGCCKTQSEYVISVHDNGIGFEMKYANKLYDIFQRLHSRDEYEGFGIGLATVRILVEKHGGKTWIHGIPGAGTVVYFTLPA